MDVADVTSQLAELGLTRDAAEVFSKQIEPHVKKKLPPAQLWQILSKQVLPNYPFHVHLHLFKTLFPHWHEAPETAPAWFPTAEQIATTNIFKFMTALNFQDVKSFHEWTVNHYQDFWQCISETLLIHFKQPSEQVCDLSQGVESPQWFPRAKLNIVDSCFTAPPTAAALVYEDIDKNICTLTYAELNKLSNQIANSLVASGFQVGDSIGIAMPMNFYAVAIYLGIIKMGGVVVSIADSFSTPEMATRLTIAKAKGVFTQDFSIWGGKKRPLYDKVKETATPLIIVLSCEVAIGASPTEQIPLRHEDIAWDKFLVTSCDFSTIACDPMTPCNILFSSGTTGTPKAIVWNHITPLKAGSDGYFHQNIQPGHVVAWPTNLGWMMGPWLVFASLINHATIALYPDVPKDRTFGEFVERAKVTMLGVVPTLVATWRQTNCMDKINWHSIQNFSSTGECSNPEDMLYLMSLANYQPVIEYCGGTEIGGAYLSSTMVEKNYPAVFTTPTMGLNVAIIDEEGHLTEGVGEVAIIPPSIGLSTQLLNADHHHVYFENMPHLPDGKLLRRHGDQIQSLPHGYYSILGRADDTMNLGGIKVSAAEIERTLTGFPKIIEVAAIAIAPPTKGPSLLVIYAATPDALDKTSTLKEMQKLINAHLNPLFKIHDVVLMNELPKTASNKIMRRVLREQYQATIKSA